MIPWKFLLLLSSGMTIGFGYFFWQSTLPSGWDVTIQLVYFRQFFLALTSDFGYPDWDALPFDGRGVPTFRFIAPLQLFLGSIFQLLGFSLVLSMKLVILLYVILGVWGVNRWFKNLGLIDESRWACFLYLVNPILTWFLFYMFFYQNFTAFLLLPLVLSDLADPKNRRFPLVSAFGFGMACLSHLPGAYMMALGIMIWGSLEAIQKRDVHVVIACILVLLIGGMIGAPYSLPAVATYSETYQGSVKEAVIPGVTTRFLNDPFIIRGANVTPAEGIPLFFNLVQQRIRDRGRADFDSSYPSPLLRQWLYFSFSLFLGFSLLGGWVKSATYSNSYAITGFVLFFMSLNYSGVLWEYVPARETILYSWRLVFPGGIFLLPWIASLVSFLKNQRKFFLLVLVVGIFAGFSLSLSWISFELNPATCLETENIPIASDVLLPTTVPRKEIMKDKEIHSTAGIPHRMWFSDEQSRLSIHQKSLSQVSFGVDIPASSTVLFINTHFDPYWKLSSDGEPMNLELNSASGTILAKIPSGKHELHFFRSSPSYRSLGWVIFFMGFLLWLSLWFRKKAPFFQR